MQFRLRFLHYEDKPSLLYLFQNGKFKHSDIESVWDPSKYAKDLYPWLLRLTEEFDLAFPLKDEEAHLVPCLLSDKDEEV